jgi:hypothetical protein
VEAGGGIDACFECAQACTACADDCLSEQKVTDLVKCIRLAADCADICVATGNIVSRQTEYDANVRAGRRTPPRPDPRPQRAGSVRRDLQGLWRRVRTPRRDGHGALPRLLGGLPPL